MSNPSLFSLVLCPLVPHRPVVLLQFFLLFMVHAYSGLVIGTGPERKLIGDGPWHWFWPCVVPWLFFQTATSMGWLHNVTGMQPVGLFSIDVLSCLVGTSKDAKSCLHLVEMP